MAYELGVGYVSIVPEVSKISPTIAKALKNTDSIANSSGESLGSKLSAGMGKTLKAGALTAGGAVGAIFGSSMAKGMGRLTAIENAQASLKGLGHDAKSIEGIMNNALSSVKGTAYGLGEAASVGASAVAAGVKPGKDLERTLKLVGDAAAIAGTGLGDMGSVFNKVATANMMQMDVANSLMDRGIPIIQMVADEMGVTAEEARKMASEGKISFEIFQNALEKNLGGSALKLGDTFTGALQNMGAAAGRMGAAFLDSGFKQAPQIIGSITDGFDKLTPAASIAGGVITSTIGDAFNLVKPLAGDISGLATSISGLIGPLSGVAAVFAINKFTQFPDMMKQVSEKGKSFNSTLFDLGQGAQDVERYFRGTGREISSFDAKLMVAQTSSNTFVKSVADGMAKARAPFNDFIDRHEQAGKSAADMALKAGDAYTSVDYMGQQMAHGFATGIGKMSRSASGFIGGTLGGMKAGFGSLVNFLGGPWGVAFTTAGIVLGELTKKHIEAKVAEEQHKQAQAELKGTLDSTTGAITAQTTELQRKRAEENGWVETANNIGVSAETLTAAMNGNEAAMRKVATATDLATQKAVEGSQTWQEYGQKWQQFGVDSNTMAAALNGSEDAIRKVNEAAAAAPAELFGGGLNTRFQELRNETEETVDGFKNLSDGVTGAAKDINDLQTRHAENELLRIQEQTEQTKKALEALGDTEFTIKDAGTIEIDASKLDEVEDQLKAIGVEIGEPKNGKVDLTFPEGADILALIEQIGLSLEYMDGGYIKVNADSLAEAQKQADLLGLSVKELPDGTIVLDYEDIPEAEQRMIGLGLLVNDGADGEVRISDNIKPVEEKHLQLRSEVEKGITGKGHINHNFIDATQKALGVRNAVESIRSRTVTVTVNEVLNSSSVARAFVPSGMQLPRVDGSFQHRRAIDGWLSDQDAMIARGGSYLTFAEDATMGEAFIPLNPAKRGRSQQILLETAEFFGLGVHDKNGVPLKRNNSSVAPKQGSRFEDGAVRIKSADAIKKGVSYMDGTPYVMGGWSRAAVDCSGAVSLVINHALGRPDFESRMSTVTEGSWLDQRGASQGRGTTGDIVIGWWDQGGGARGHTSLMLQDGTCIESGGGTGGGFTIGRGARINGQNFTHWRHFKGSGTTKGKVSANSQIIEDEIINEYGSLDVYQSRNRSVDWGSAGELFNMMKKYTQAPLFDVGGRWPSGMPARNESKADELVLTNAQWKHLSTIASSLPVGGREFNNAAKTLVNGLKSAEKTTLNGMRNFGVVGGHDLLAHTELVMDAERGLRDTRRELVVQLDDINKAEKDLKEAREELAKIEKEGGGLTVEQKRKQADAEAALNKARAQGNPDEIAKAEQKLARVREDNNNALKNSKEKNAKEVLRAQEKVNKAEDNLTNARLDHEEVLAELTAAEKTVIAARIQAAGQIAQGVTGAFANAFGSMSSMFDEMAKAARIVEETRQEVARLYMAQQTNALNTAQALQQYRIAEWDVARTRVRGALSIAEAEDALEKARENAALAGQTSIEALKGAMDRYYETGIFGLETLSDEAIEATDEVQAALWGVKVAEKQHALDMLEATKAQLDAQAKVADATIKQAIAAELLQTQTTALAQQTAQLNGMTANQATGAAKGWQGAGKVAGGVGKSIGGAATGAALGFAVAGPLGALAGGLIGALAGTKDIVEGAKDINANKDAMKESWNNMDGGQKAGIILGSIFGVGVTAAGAASGNPAIADFTSEIGTSITDAALGGTGYGILSEVEASQLELEDKLEAAKQKAEKQEWELAKIQLERELEYIELRDRLMAELEEAKLNQQIHQTDSERVKEALKAAIEVERLRSTTEKLGSDQITELTKLNTTLDALLEVSREQLEKIGKPNDIAFGAYDVIYRQSVSSADYINSRI